MDDVIDRRTRQIYASLADHELVRQLEAARVAAAQREHRPQRASAQPGPHRALGTRPWVPAGPVEASDRGHDDSTAPDEQAHVVDLRAGARPSTTVDVTADVTASSLQVLVRHQPSEWAMDDPSYYLG
jgi:hypothetical protein